MPPSSRWPYVAKRMPMGNGEVHLVMRSRKRSRHASMRRHSHLVIYNPALGVLVCTCPAWAYRLVCSATRAVLRGWAR